MPIGTIWPYVGDLDKIPTGWHLCDGTESTPDLRDRFLQSYGTNAAKQTIEAGLPNIKGGLHGLFCTEQDGAINIDSRLQYLDPNVGSWYHYSWYEGHVAFNAGKYNPIYSDECTTVQPPAYTVYYIIKMA